MAENFTLGNYTGIAASDRGRIGFRYDEEEDVISFCVFVKPNTDIEPIRRIRRWVINECPGFEIQALRDIAGIPEAVESSLSAAFTVLGVGSVMQLTDNLPHWIKGFALSALETVNTAGIQERDPDSLQEMAAEYRRCAMDLLAKAEGCEALIRRLRRPSAE